MSSTMHDNYEYDEYEDVGMAHGRQTEKKPASVNVHSLIIKKSKNSREFKKYHELVGSLILNYYRRFGDMDEATRFVCTLVDEAQTVEGLQAHYAALMHDDSKVNGEKSTEHAKNKIANTLLSDYKKRFGTKKGDAYNVLVLQGWVGKIESVNELAILMDSILTIRDRIGNSWDYEVHVVPLLLDKAFSTDVLIDYSTSMTNLIIGLSRRLNDSYLAVMTAVKILEYADSPKVIKAYLRDMIKDANKRMDQLNTELAVINAGQVTRVTKVIRARDIRTQVSGLARQIDEMQAGIDPKELMLDGAKR